MNLSAHRKKISSLGFTLIELLVVIAVMGVLATIVLVAIDPAEQFNRAEDGNRKQTVNTLGNAAIQYATARSTATSPNVTEGSSWLTYLTNAGELKQVPPASGVACNTTYSAASGNGSGYCYNLETNDFTVWAAMESKAEDNQSSGAACGTSTDTNVGIFVYDSSTGKTCKVCGTASSFVSVPGNATTGCP